MRRTHFASGEVAAQVGVPRWRLLYLIDKGEVPGPSLQVPGRRLFTADDVQRIADALAKRRPAGGEVPMQSGTMDS
jgi:hypothetical protein